MNDIDNWYFPRLYYSRTFQQGEVKVLFVFIDTWELVGGNAEVNGDVQTIVDAQQLRWMKDVLKTNEYDYKIVVGHYPIRSARRETIGLVKDLLPVLVANDVDAYIFGHDHVGQHLQRDGINYFGSGIGGRMFKGKLHYVDGLKWHKQSTLGFLSLVLTKSQMTVNMHDVHGNEESIAYTVSIPNQRNDEENAVQIELAVRLRSSLLGDW